MMSRMVRDVTTFVFLTGVFLFGTVRSQALAYTFASMDLFVLPYFLLYFTRLTCVF